MKVTQEKIDALNGIIRIELEHSDYQENLGKSLREYARKANIKGFRPGMVPVGMVKKMYGPSILLEELQGLLSKTLPEYMRDNKIETLGEPLPVKLKTLELDPEAKSSYTFEFEIGYAPEFTFDLNKVKAPGVFKVSVDDESLEKEVLSLRERYSTYQDTATIENDENFLILEFSNEHPAAGLPGSFSRAVKMGNIPSAELKGRLMGKSKDDVIDNVKPGDVFPAEADMKRALREALGMESEPSSALMEAFTQSVWSVKAGKIVKMQPAEENEAFFQGIFPTKAIDSPAAFREALRADLETFYAEDADFLFRSKVLDAVLDAHPMDLPDAFLKKWLKETSDKITDETLEKEYADFARITRWQLIVKKIREADTTIQVEADDIRNEAMKRAASYYARQGGGADEQTVKALSESIMRDQELTNKIYREKLDEKVFNWLRKALNPKEEAVTVKAYIERNTPQKS